MMAVEPVDSRACLRRGRRRSTGRSPGSSQASSRCSRIGIAVAEGEAQRDGAGRGGRLELDIGDAVLALDVPDGARALEAGELARLLRIGLDRRIIRRRQLEIAGEAVMDRAGRRDR